MPVLKFPVCDLSIDRSGRLPTVTVRVVESLSPSLSKIVSFEL